MWIAAVAFVCVALVPVVHRAALSWTGAFLATSDPLQRADVVFQTWESADAGLLEAADLYREGWVKSIVLLEPSGDSVDEEFDRRGIHFPEVAVSALLQLGVPQAAITRASSGEGGTTDSTAALVDWVRTQHIGRAVVVVSPTHGRRYRRALMRIWPPEFSVPIVHTTRYNLFHADTWWRSRRTLREGVVEIQKLLVDYVAHPF